MRGGIFSLYVVALLRGNTGHVTNIVNTMSLVKLWSQELLLGCSRWPTSADLKKTEHLHSVGLEVDYVS